MGMKALAVGGGKIELPAAKCESQRAPSCASAGRGGAPREVPANRVRPRQAHRRRGAGTEAGRPAAFHGARDRRPTCAQLPSAIPARRRGCQWQAPPRRPRAGAGAGPRRRLPRNRQVARWAYRRTSTPKRLRRRPHHIVGKFSALVRFALRMFPATARGRESAIVSRAERSKEQTPEGCRESYNLPVHGARGA